MGANEKAEAAYHGLDGPTERIAEQMKRHTVMHSATAGRDTCVTCGPLTPEHSTRYQGIFDRERTHQAEQVRAVLGETTPNLATTLERHARALAVLNGAPIPMGEVRTQYAAEILRGDR